MQDSPFLRYPVLQVRPYGLIAYDRTEYPTARRKEANAAAFRMRSGEAQYLGLLTPGARKRLKRSIQLICAIAEPKTAIAYKTGKEFKFKLNFITLTLPGKQGEITDSEIKKKCLEPFLLDARRHWKCRSYIWRAERQKNGNLHFHLVTDTYIPYDQLRDTWNRKLNNLGFIDRFEQKHGHRHPNSTDVHAIHNIRNLASYFSKYMAKGERVAEDLYRVPFARQIWHEKMLIAKGVKYKRVLTREESRIDGKLWDCSQNLKIKANCEMLLESEQLEIWQEAEKDSSVKVVHSDTCTIMFLNPWQFKKYVRGYTLQKYLEWLALIKAPPNADNCSQPDTRHGATH